VNSNVAKVKEGKSPVFVSDLDLIHLDYRTLVGGYIVNSPYFESYNQHKVSFELVLAPEWI
jgi:hypothetical protein